MDLQSIYKRAAISSTPGNHNHCFYFYDKQNNQYIEIPKEDLPEKEYQLLACFLTPVNPQPLFSQHSFAEQSWYDFLFDGAPLPPVEAKRVRFIHVQVSENDREAFFNAIDTFFDHQLLVVWTAEKQCLLIEEESKHPIEKDDIRMFIDVLAEDFYMTGRLFIGRFSAAESELRFVWERERKTAQSAAELIPENRVTSVEMVMPHLFLADSRSKLAELFSDEKQLFESDEDLRSTLQVFIQNNLNASQTAKQLHLHRNSLQYRIDKFIDRTGLDVRSYEGALLVYMLCLLSLQKS